MGSGEVYEAGAGVGGGELYAEQIFDALTSGASASIMSGELVQLPARSLAAPWMAMGEVF